MNMPRGPQNCLGGAIDTPGAGPIQATKHT